MSPSDYPVEEVPTPDPSFGPERVVEIQLTALADTDDPVETAIVGHGRSHPVVVLVRDLLGPRLDHLDFQSDAFSDELPT